MFRDAIIIFRKEAFNVFKDKGAVFSIFILPFLIMPAIFVTIGFFTELQETRARETIYNINFINVEDETFKEILSNYIHYNSVPSDYEEEFLTIEFPDNYIPGNYAEVKIFFDSTSQKSDYASRMIDLALNSYKDLLSEDILQTAGLSLSDLNIISSRRIDTAPEEAQGSMFAAQMIPYMLLIYIFSSGMGIALDTTAGEKERGSLASVLVNQVSRSSIALGKIFYVITMGLMNAFFTFAGMIFAFFINDKLLSADFTFANLDSFTPGAIVMLLFTVLLMSGVASSLLVLLGSLAKNMKQASGFASPIIIGAVVVGLATMGADPSANLALYLIPVANGVFMLKDIITMQFNTMNFVLVAITNLSITAILVFFTSKLFNSEKILNTV